MKNDIVEVIFSDLALKQFEKIPGYLQEKLYKWVKQVGRLGMSEVRKIKGYHDEALLGKRIGQRSIRLNKKYRAIYVSQRGDKHDY